MNNPKAGGGDRRHFRRVDISPNVITPPGATALDLSEIGLSLQTQVAHRTGSQISLELEIDEQSLLLEGEVKWCNQSASAFQSGYRIGIQFIGLKPTQLLILRAYLERHTKEADSMTNSPTAAAGGRRRHQRVAISRNVLKTPGVTALDLSESGMLLGTQAPYRSGSQISLELEIDEQSLLLEGEVKWCNESASALESGYRMGIQFIGLRPTHLLILRSYIDRHTKEAD